MAFKLDRVYESNGTELTNALHTTTLSGAVNMEYDGRYLWVACGTAGIGIYEWWGAASDNEPAWETLDELVYPRYDSGLKKKLRLVTYITVGASSTKRTTCLEPMAESGATTYSQSSGETAYAKSTARTGTALNAYYIKKCADKMYVTNGANFREVFEFSIDTQNLLSVINVEETYLGMTHSFVTGTTFTKGTKYAMNSNLESANNKLWFVGTAFGDDWPQKLYSYDVLTGTRTTTDIPARPSLARTWVANGYNGSVYISNYNNVSVTRFSNVDGSLGAVIRSNAFTTHMHSTPDRRIWASSYGGMLTLIDWDDDGVHHDYSSGIGTESRAVSLHIDPTDTSKVWFVTASQQLIRHDLNTHQQLEGFGTNDWSFTNTKLGSPEVAWVSQPMYFQDSTLTTHQLKPYIFLLQDGKLLAWKLDKYLYRDVYATVNGQGAVVEGPQQYFGE